MSDAQFAVRMATHCGNCGMRLGDVFYIRQQPARLICQRCRDQEVQQPNSTGGDSKEKT